jgi:hypothetical protein
MNITGNNNAGLGGEMVVVLGPEHARILADDGMSKDDVRQELHRRLRLDLSRFGSGLRVVSQARPATDVGPEGNPVPRRLAADPGLGRRRSGTAFADHSELRRHVAQHDRAASPIRCDARAIDPLTENVHGKIELLLPNGERTSPGAASRALARGCGLEGDGRRLRQQLAMHELPGDEFRDQLRATTA